MRRLLASLIVLGASVTGFVPSAASASPPVRPTVAQPAAAQPAAGSFRPVPMVRVLDTRKGSGLAPRATTRVAVSGGSIPTGAAAVTLNLTILAAGRAGSIAVFPGGTAWNGSASISFPAGQTKQSMVTAKLGTDGSLSVRNNTAVTLQVIGDVVGYYTGGTPTAAGTFAPIPQQRVFDTRAAGSTPVPTGGTARIRIAGRGAIPASGVGAVLANVTVIDPARAGGLQTYPSGGYDASSSLSFAAGRTEQDVLSIRLGGDGAIVVRNTAPVAVQVVLDAIGYLRSGPPAVEGSYQPVTPVRAYDSRLGNARQGPIPSGHVVTLLAGQGGYFGGKSSVPGAGVPAELVRFSVLTPTRAGSISVYPAAAGWNGAASISFGAGATVQQQLTVVPDADSRWQLRNNTAVPIQVVVDVLGYYLGVPNPLHFGAGQLIDPPRGTVRAMSCPVAGFCAAVQQEGYAEFWNGSTWTKPARVAQAAYLLSVSCASSSLCMASGQLERGAEQVYRYDGNAWTVSTTLSEPTDRDSGRPMVSCTSNAVCVVSNGARYRTYSASAWSAEKPIAGEPYVDGLSCTSASFCVAVDYLGNAYRYNGSSWTKQAGVLPANTTYTWPMSVSCASATLCAVGGSAEVAIYHGTSWSPSTTVTGLRFITSVSCAGSTCRATDGTGQVASYDGTGWSGPAPTGVQYGAVLSCASATSCLIVGIGSITRSAVLDGTSWSQAVLLDVLPGGMSAVSCVSASFCMAVDRGGYALRYDGASWAAPEVIDPGAILDDVSCASPSFCAAVDSDGAALTFDGTRWSAKVWFTNDQFRNLVSCATPTLCVAGDQFGDLVRYDGSRWTMAGGSRILTGPVKGISCPTATFCTAVDDTGHASTFDGTGWSTPTPTSLTTAAGVSCTDSSFCLATGTGTTTAASWNGTGWSPVSVPLTDALHASCPAAGHCVITGRSPVGRTVMLVWDQGRSSMSMDSPADSQWPLPQSCATSTFCMLLDDSAEAYPMTG